MGPRRKSVSARRQAQQPEKGVARGAPRAIPRDSAYLGEPLPQDSGQESLVLRLTLERRQAVGEHLQAPSVQGLDRLMGQSFELLDNLVAQVDFDPPMVCCRGCDACCYNPISLTPPEALCLGLAVLDRFRGSELDALKDRLALVLERMRGKTRQELGAIRHLLPCPLLLDGACSVHLARPLVCRGWNGVDRAQCDRSLAERDPMALIENHPLPRLLADHIQLGLLKGSADLGLEAGYLALPRALGLMLEHGVVQCAQGWLSGKPFFGRWSG